MEEVNLTNNCSSIPLTRPEVVIAQQVTVSLTCVLSILGATLIIFTYFAFKDLRTGARQLLVQLSIADIFVAASHMFGVLYNLPSYIQPCSTGPTEHVGVGDVACEVQAGFTMFGVIATFLWTLAMAVYLLVIIVFEKKVVGKRLSVVFFVLCWGVPLVQVVVFGCLRYLGFDESLDIGWCYLTWVNTSSTAQHRILAPQLFAYTLWSYLTYLLLPLLYIWIRCYVRVKLARVHNRSSSQPAPKSRLSDVKLTFIPVVFLLLRLSATGLSIPHVYLPYESRVEFRKSWWNVVLVLIAGIGTSAQGLMNAILFCVFTRVVRQRLIQTVKRVCCFWKTRSTTLYMLQPTPPPSTGMGPDVSSDDEATGDTKHLLVTNGSLAKYQSVNQRVAFYN